jgi:hypothetical protein
MGGRYTPGKGGGRGYPHPPVSFSGTTGNCLSDEESTGSPTRPAAKQGPKPAEGEGGRGYLPLPSKNKSGLWGVPQWGGGGGSPLSDTGAEWLSTVVKLPENGWPEMVAEG